jgi:hypothetical protein
MRKSILTMAAIAASVFAMSKADAMPLGSGLGQAADGLSTVEQTQFFYSGREYCWYPDGWHGPGFYVCGFAFRPGFGWGGPIGWRGWHHGGGGARVIGPRFGGRGGGAMVVGPRGGRAFVGPRGGGGGPRMGGGGGGGGGGHIRRH